MLCYKHSYQFNVLKQEVKTINQKTEDAGWIIWLFLLHLCHYLFIIVTINLHSNGRWVMTFQMDVLNRVLDIDVSRKQWGDSHEHGPTRSKN